MATTTLLGFWALGSVMLLRQEEGMTLREGLRQLRVSLQVNPLGRRVFLRGIREYLRRDFHPWQNNNLSLARQALARVEATLKGAA